MKKNMKVSPFYLPHPQNRPVQWVIASKPVPYPEAIARMEERVGAIYRGEAREMVWLLEHPPLYSAGTSANTKDLIDPGRFPVFSSGRGGQYTYHGPGQRVAYVMLDLRERGRDVRALVRALEEWIILALAELGVKGEVHDDRIGVWVTRRDAGKVREDKVAAIGIRLRHWISFHGISLNVSPDLSHFEGIVPCGIRDHGVTSLKGLGLVSDMKVVDAALQKAFIEVFGELKIMDEFGY